MSGPISPTFGLLPGEGPSDPTRREVLVAGTVPVAVAVCAALWPTGFAASLRAILWTSLLMPIGLLALYRGRRGAVVGLALSLVIFLVGEYALRALFGRPVVWELIGVGTVVVASSAWAIGAVSARLHEMHREALAVAFRDEDTGLPRRELAELFLDQQVAAAERGDPMTLVLFRIDGLPALARSHGEAAVASVLGRVGDGIRKNSRGMDVAGRWDDDEVVAILPDTDARGARVYAVRCLEKLSGLSAETADGALIGSGVVVRAGIAPYAADVRSPGELVDRARRAAEAAANGDGGRITVFSSPQSEPA